MLKEQGMSGNQSQIHSSERAEAWTNYWRTGNRHSCLVTKQEGAVDVPVHDEGWREFFGTLQESAHILDVGTGNGAVALLAYEVGQAENRNFKIHGVDAAEIVPEVTEDAEEDYLQFHSVVPMEKLPFADNTFDCAVSQYALEYSDIGVSLSEIARVLKPDGKARFIMHSVDSGPVQSSVQELKVLKQILDDIGILKLLRAMIVTRTEKPAKAGLADRKVEKGLKKLEAVIQVDRATMHHATFFRLGVDYYNNRMSPARADILRRLDAMTQDYACVRERLNQMTGAALDAKAFEVFQKQASAQSLETTKAEHLSDTGEITGWLIELSNKDCRTIKL